MINRNPWLGLATYDEQTIREGYKFCGRERATKELYSIVDNNICTTLYGKSGIGKSSLLQAGLFPRLRADNYFPVMIRLGIGETKQAYSTTIISAIKSAIEEAGGQYTSTADADDTAEEQLKSFFRTTEFRDSSGEIIFPIIVLDQFEELYFRDRAPLNTLLKAIYLLVDDNATETNGEEDIINYRIVISIREDDLFHLEESIDKLRLTEMKSNRYRLRELSDEEAHNVITQPAGTLLAPDEREQIATTIIKEAKAGSEEISTAILSLICSRIYDSTPDKATITHQQVTTFFKAAEGNFLKSFYDDIIKELRSPAKWYYIEDALVTDEGRRNSVPKSEFERRIPDAPFLFRGEKSMLRYVTLPGNDEPRVEIIHDTLARQMLSSKTERKLKQQATALRRQRLTATAIIITILGIAATFWFQYRSIVAERNGMMKMQAHYITEKVEKILKDGDITLAIRLLLSILPSNTENQNRPCLVDTEIALRTADETLSSNGYNCIYHIKYPDNTYIYTAKISPDNKWIATTADDNNLKIWYAETGILYKTINNKPKGLVDFSPNGKQIAISSDNCVRILDIESGNQIVKLMQVESRVSDIGFSPDGKYIAIASGINSVKICDAATGNLIRHLNTPEDINSFRFTPISDNIIVYSNHIKYFENNAKKAFHNIYIFNIESGKQIGTTIKNNNFYNSVESSPNGKYIVTTDEDYICKIWEVNTGKLFQSFKIESFSKYARFSHNGKYIHIPEQGNFWYIQDQKYYTYGNRPKYITGVIESSDDMKYYITRRLSYQKGNSTYLEVYRVIRRTNREISNIPKYNFTITDHIIAPDEKHFLTVQNDSTIRIWNENGEQIGEPIKHPGDVWKANFSHDGKFIVSHSDKIAFIWDVNTRKCYKMRHDKPIQYSDFCPNNNVITVSEGIINIWNFTTRERNLIDFNKEILTASFSQNGEKIISSTSDSTAIIIDYTSRKIEKALPKHNAIVTTAKFSPDGKYIVTESNKITRIWDTGTYKMIGKPITMDWPWSYFHFSDDSKYLTITNYGRPYIYDTETGKLISKLSKSNQYNNAKFSQDGKSVIILDGHKIMKEGFPTLQELIDKYKKLLGNWELTDEELTEYNFR